MSIKEEYKENNSPLYLLCESDNAGDKNINANNYYVGFFPPRIPSGNNHAKVEEYTSLYKIDGDPIKFPKVGTQPSFACDVLSDIFLGPFYKGTSTSAPTLQVGTVEVVIKWSETSITIEDWHYDSSSPASLSSLYKTEVYGKDRFRNNIIPRNILICLQAAGGVGGRSISGTQSPTDSGSGAGGGAGACGYYIIPIAELGTVTVVLGENAADFYPDQSKGTSGIISAENSSICTSTRCLVELEGGANSSMGNTIGASRFASNYLYGSVGNGTVSSAGCGRYNDGSTTHGANSNITREKTRFDYHLYSDSSDVYAFFRSVSNSVGSEGIDDETVGYGGGGGAAAGFLPALLSSGFTSNGLTGCNAGEDGRGRDVTNYVGSGGGGAYMKSSGVGEQVVAGTPGGRAACRILLGYSA